jgi:hypothetical protein
LFLVQSPLPSGLNPQSSVIPGESAEEFAQLQAEYTRRFAPTDLEERYHVDTLIRHEWILRRCRRIEPYLAADPNHAGYKALQSRIKLAQRSTKHALAALKRSHDQKLASFRQMPSPPFVM